MPPLFVACECGRPDNVSALIEMKCDAHAGEGAGDQNALRYAVKACSRRPVEGMETIRLLIEHRVKPGESARGFSLLHDAAALDPLPPADQLIALFHTLLKHPVGRFASFPAVLTCLYSGHSCRCVQRARLWPRDSAEQTGGAIATASELRVRVL